jgi:cytidyltransferase-like protein
MEKNKRILVDMSATLLHHGHIRLLKKAADMGYVIVALTLDDEVKNTKGYTPELNYLQRKEILESIRYVDEVIPSPWLITNDFLETNNIDYLVHGHDNKNPIDKSKLVIFPRTSQISSDDIRFKCYHIIVDRLNW